MKGQSESGDQFFSRIVDHSLTVNKGTTKGKAFFGNMKSSVRPHVIISEVMRLSKEDQISMQFLSAIG